MSLYGLWIIQRLFILHYGKIIYYIFYINVKFYYLCIKYQTMSRLDIKKLIALQADLDKKAKQEIYENLPDGLIHFLKDDVINYSLDDIKTRNQSELSARVLNSWIDQGIVKVDGNDKGKINRFTREEALWLNLANELRSFGVSLDVIKTIREELFNEPFPHFTLFRYAIVSTIFDSGQLLILFPDGNFNVMSSELYKMWINGRGLPSHICIDFLNLLSAIFTENSFNEKITDREILEDNLCVKILYFLRTGDFETFKIEVTKGDVRLIESADQLASNLNLMSTVIKGNYLKAEVLSNGRLFLIKP